MKTWTIARITLREATRQPAYVVILLVLVALVGSSYFLSDFQLRADRTRDIGQMGIATMTLCGLILAILGCSRGIHREVEERTLLTILSKPIGRPSFVIGKFLGVFSSILLADLVILLALIAAMWMYEQDSRGARVENLKEEIDEYFAKNPELSPVTTVEEFRRELALPIEKVTGERKRSAGALAVESFRYGLLLLSEWDSGTGTTIDTAYSQLAAAQVLAEESDRGDLVGRIQRLRAFCVNQLSEGRFSLALPLILKAALLAIMQTAIFTAMAIVVSVRFPFEVSAIVVPVFFILGHFVDRIGEFFTGRGWTYAGQAIYYLLPNLEDFNIDRTIAMGGTVSGSYLVVAATYGGVITAGLLLVAIWLFQERELG